MIKRGELSRSSSLTAHHFFTLLNFVTLLVTVAWLLFNAHLLRREIESLKADIQPLLAANKKPSQPFADFVVFKSRNIRQLGPGGDDGGGGHGMMMMTAAPNEGDGGHSMMTAAPESPHDMSGPQTTKEAPHGGMDSTGQPQPQSSPVKLKCTQVCPEGYPSIRIVTGPTRFPSKKNSHKKSDKQFSQWRYVKSFDRLDNKEGTLCTSGKGTVHAFCSLPFFGER